MEWSKEVEDDAARQVERRKTSEKIQGCSERGYAWADVTEEDARGRVRWRQMEAA